VGVAAGAGAATRRIDSAPVRRGRLVPLLAAVALLAAGCDWSKPGGKVVSPTPQTVEGTVPQATKTAVPAKYAHGDAAAGKTVFAQGPCAGCHTLQAAGTHGTVGPNLDDAKPDLGLVVDRVVNGKGGMPSFKGQLSDKQISDVAAFVFESTH
jgi:mono/diheme cytochrome c family protein